MKKTLNVGCGERVYEEYPKGFKCINFDTRKLDGVDVIGDVRNLGQFEDNEFNYVLASDIIEHFPLAQTPLLLKEWARVLMNYGVLEIRTPNLSWAAEHYVKHRDAKFISWHIFGEQNYPENYHFVIFDLNSLMYLCKQTGFVYLDHKEEGSNLILKVRKEVQNV